MKRSPTRYFILGLVTLWPVTVLAQLPEASTAQAQVIAADATPQNADVTTPEKPACSSATAGRVWPPEAQHNPSGAAATRTGIQVCSHEAFRYRWRAVTVSYQELIDKADRKQKHAPHVSSGS